MITWTNENIQSHKFFPKQRGQKITGDPYGSTDDMSKP